jgi:AraC-like DNA-binding protein
MERELKRVDTITRVRRAFHAQGWSLKRITRELHASRYTVRRILRSGETDFTDERGHQPRPRIGPWREHLDRFLQANEGKPPRERLTLIRIHERVRGLGYEGSCAAVRRHARTRPKARGSVTADACVPLCHAPGEACQCAWSHGIVLINGVTVTVKVAHVRLCHSRMMFARAHRRGSQEPQPSGSDRWRRDGFDDRRP